ncbi:protein tyrosine phosphatase receptor type C-associated protein [Ranitomeya imitator]
MENRIRTLGTLLIGSWLSLLPVTQASPSDGSSDSTLTVVFLLLLLILLCVALILAWKKLIHTEGGEDYHPQELWGRAQEFMQNAKTRWTPGEQEEESTVEDNQDEEDVELKDEEPDITAL